MWSDILFFLGAFATFVYIFFKRKYNYWANLGVPYAEPCFPYGNLGDFGNKQHITEFFNMFYKQFRGKTPLMGFYSITTPQAMILDLDLIQRILIKDFQYFHDRSRYYNLEDDPLTGHLLNLDGERWRTLRTKISPTFTSGKIKLMQPMVLEVAENFHRTLFKEIGSEADVEIKDYFARFSTDVIGSCAFGLDCNSLQNSNTEFRKYGDKVFSLSWLKAFRVNFAVSFMTLARKLHICLLDRDVSEFYRGVVSDAMKYRKETGARRNDFLDLLMQISDSKDDKNCEEGKLTVDEIAAQSLLFFLASFDASSTIMTFALYELAKQPYIQDKARKNVRDTLFKYGGKFTYEVAMEMDYLDQIINESMRIYSPNAILSRRVTQDYQVPGTKIVLKQGTSVAIPIHAIQNDPEIFSEPQKFDPDRFSPENVKNRHNAAFLPFGDGPRNCIAKRFAMMKVRIGLATVLKSFYVIPSSRTPDTVILKKDTIAMTAEGGMWLTLKRIPQGE